MSGTKDIDERFMLLNREAGLISGLLSGGLADFHKITYGDSFYYEAFYSISLGLERLLKLVLILQHPNTDLKSFGHSIPKLLDALGIKFPEGSIEETFVNFLSQFASKDRYSIPDLLSSGQLQQHGSEPIYKFDTDVAAKILEQHPPRASVSMPQLQEIMYLFHIGEDFRIETDPSQLPVMRARKEQVARFAAVYSGRIIRPAIDLLEQYSGAAYGNPYFEEHFVYLKGNDAYFRDHKTFRR